MLTALAALCAMAGAWFIGLVAADLIHYAPRLWRILTGEE
jgi:hypothetical protein